MSGTQYTGDYSSFGTAGPANTNPMPLQGLQETATKPIGPASFTPVAKPNLTPTNFTPTAPNPVTGASPLSGSYGATPPPPPPRVSSGDSKGGYGDWETYAPRGPTGGTTPTPYTPPPTPVYAPNNTNYRPQGGGWVPQSGFSRVPGRDYGDGTSRRTK